MTSTSTWTRRTILGTLAAAPVAAAIPTGAWASTTPVTSSDPILGFVLDRRRIKRIDLPGNGDQTVLAGISNTGRIVGKTPSVDAVGFDGLVGDVRGFRRFAFPGARATYATKVNQRGQIVGAANRRAPTVGSPGTFGYLVDRGRFTRIAVSDAVYTQAHGLNNRGQVVGEFLDEAGVFHGFRWERGRFTTFDGPLGGSTSITDINDRGVMVGLYIAEDGTGRGFQLRGDTYTTFGAVGLPVTLPWDINNLGQVAGSSFDLVAEGHGFLFADGIDQPVTQIDVPGASATNVFGLDDRGRLLGIYVNPNAGGRAVPAGLPRQPLGLTARVLQ